MDVLSPQSESDAVLTETTTHYRSTHNCLAEFTDHAITSTSLVTHLFPLHSTNTNEKKNSMHFGLLCVIQKNGIFTLYDVANQNRITKIRLNCEIYCACLVPCQEKSNQYLRDAILSIDTSGYLMITQWKLANLPMDNSFHRSSICAETLEIGTNIFKEISRKGKPTNLKYCIYIQNNLRSSMEALKFFNKNTKSKLSTSLKLFSNTENPTEFNLITVSVECTRRKIIRLTSWYCKAKQLSNTVSYNKILSNDPNANLIDISVTESGCSGSLCICFTNEVFWLSLHTFDILSKFKLPSFMSPIQYLAYSWPQPADLNKVYNRRTWICVNKNRLLEISPFESQRRLDIKGRACLLVYPTGPTDTPVTTIASGLGITPLVSYDFARYSISMFFF
ncbi:unnamed protein product [Trichobilharzia regenti]|nr:unnamed protein product [Trichobilharzia regenti]